MTIITTLVTRWTRICNHDDDDDGDDYDDDDDDKYHDHIYDNLKAKELVDLLSDVVQVAVDPPQDVQLVKIIEHNSNLLKTMENSAVYCRRKKLCKSI